MLCGSSCVKYILKESNINYKINNNMNWITELAITLNKDFNVELMCFNSNLFNDYKMFHDYTFDGFKYIKDALDLNIFIKEIQLTKKELIKEICDNKYIIMCVQSSVFNKDNSMSGGHFIIINGINNDIVSIVNPIKDKYDFISDNVDNVINYCKDFGCWRLLIKEK